MQMLENGILNLTKIMKKLLRTYKLYHCISSLSVEKDPSDIKEEVEERILISHL